jgi:flavin-dependent dehydrogenase
MHVKDGACLGIAPVQSGPNPLCNVTVVMQTSHAPARAGTHEIMRAALHRFTNRDLSDLIADDDVILASGPFDWPTGRIAFDGAALIGDAAGYYDPFTGQGIFQALAGAELLAEHSAQALRSGVVTRPKLVQYEARQRALVGGARRVQRIVEYVCARPRAADLLFSAFARTPEAASRLIAVTGDLRPVRDLLSPVTLARLIVAAALHSTV